MDVSGVVLENIRPVIAVAVAAGCDSEEYGNLHGSTRVNGGVSWQDIIHWLSQ